MRIEMKYPPKLGWPERILAVAITILVLFVGLTLGIVILGILAAAAAVVGVRLWWLRRRLRREGIRGEASIIETHYEVVEEHPLLLPPKAKKKTLRSTSTTRSVRELGKCQGSCRIGHAATA